tara:strand:+ start:179 stop:355 length:177 start_codon:yes stop_codon:yes gene_type:complete
LKEDRHIDPLDSPLDILAYLIVDPYNPDDIPFVLPRESSLLFGQLYSWVAFETEVSYP